MAGWGEAMATDLCDWLGPPWPKDVGESIQTGVSGQAQSSGKQVVDLPLSPSSASGGRMTLGRLCNLPVLISSSIN